MSDRAEGFRTLTPDEVASALAGSDEVFLIDIREPRQYHAGHIADAIFLPAGDFADRYTRELDPEDKVIIVCERGETSAAAARFLVSQGFSDVATMEGGMRAWTGPLAARA
jgi:rhodanese-related sulfurtransferase